MKVELINQTSVINVAYRDTGKDHVSKVANLISQKYQIYSDKDRINYLDKGINYLNNQVAEKEKNLL